MPSSAKREKFQAPIGVGIDIVEVHRFERLDRRHHQAFLNRVFAPAELRYCFGRANTGQHLAVRFAAKEAVKKALHTVGVHQVPYRKIEITNDAHGAPRVRLVGIAPWHVLLSMSHTADSAAAVAVILPHL